MYSFSSRARLNKIIPTLFVLLLSVYIVFHILYGERGLISFFEYRIKEKILTNSVEQAKIKRVYLEHKVKGLRSSSLDLDLLDEHARKLLPVAKPNEIVIYKQKSKYN